jgi:Protein of unknown function (DUF1207)
MPGLHWKWIVLTASLLSVAAVSRGQTPGLPLSQLEPLAGANPSIAQGGTVGGGMIGGDMVGGEVMAGPPQTYFDLDTWLGENAGPTCPRDDWHWQILPDGLIYKAYLAGAKESRLSTQVFHLNGAGTLWDSTLGGRVGIFRYGTDDSAWPQGWQWDLEGSAQLRLEPDDERDLGSADFRAGTGLTYGYVRHRLRMGYYHISSHVGDEFLLKNPGFDRINYVRDALNLGYSYYWTDNLRLYAETSWAFYGDFTGNWEFQFGIDYAPARPTGLRGAPFWAINGHLRQELNYSGNLVVQVGWAWRGDRSGHLLRTGLHYYNGMSNQYSFFRDFEQQIGAGLWYDY